MEVGSKQSNQIEDVMMHEKKLYTITDLGPGDGGKGGVVHKISHIKRAHTILKVGGAQGSHGVTTSAGDSFAFSQWGCGTFDGIKTHMTERIVVSPEGILNEGEALYYGCGIRDVFDLITVDENAICATPFHTIASHLKELARGNNPRGTIGSGVGESYRYAELYPDLTIRVRDLAKPSLKDLLANVREKISENLQPIIAGEFLPADREQAKEEVALLNNPDFLDFTIKRFQEVPNRVKVVDGDYLRQILSQDGIVVVESSHGVLTDHYQGFHPHTSAIRTLPCFTHAMIRNAGYDGEVVNIGVSRAYQVRHGAGPMPTADPTMDENLLPGSHKADNRYQGKIRVGPLDLVLLRYAIASCGGEKVFDGLAITWFDQIQKNRIWRICDRYVGADDQTFFSPSGELKVRHGSDEMQLSYQEAVGQQLKNCLPEINEFPVSLDSNREELFDWCAEILGEKLDVNIRMVSFGPSERDKVCK
jgi:adenylosuccinate synthase